MLLHCIALHCIALHCIALHCIALHCIALHCIALHCIALHCIALHCIALHCIALHCIALHCIALHCRRFVSKTKALIPLCTVRHHEWRSVASDPSQGWGCCRSSGRPSDSLCSASLGPLRSFCQALASVTQAP